jgi:hypothetical protein
MADCFSMIGIMAAASVSPRSPYQLLASGDDFCADIPCASSWRDNAARRSFTISSTVTCQIDITRRWQTGIFWAFEKYPDYMFMN